mmetsp:Transcript_18249/g.51106  ORF Transcript_18249/g.51106 Transcript_18249/m.51106 type:complete len:215 (+) Transcript_18249:1066-1710(+)
MGYLWMGQLLPLLRWREWRTCRVPHSLRRHGLPSAKRLGFPLCPLRFRQWRRRRWRTAQSPCLWRQRGLKPILRRWVLRWRVTGLRPERQGVVQWRMRRRRVLSFGLLEPTLRRGLTRQQLLLRLLSLGVYEVRGCRLGVLRRSRRYPRRPPYWRGWPRKRRRMRSHPPGRRLPQSPRFGRWGMLLLLLLLLPVGPLRHGMILLQATFHLWLIG